MSLKQLVAQAQYALEELPHTSDGIARVLNKEKITGLSIPSCCPLANYLRKKLELPVSKLMIWVNPNYLQLRYLTDDLERSSWDIVLPGPARAFVLKFDAGEYPDLVRNPYDE